MQTGHPEAAPNYYDQAGNLRTGTRISRTLLTGKEDAPDNFRLGYSYGGDDAQWTTPRHHHNFEQVRFVLDGEYSVASRRTLPAGWVGYFPESAYYGPQDINPTLTMLILQFGGPSGQGYASIAQRKKGLEDLKARADGELKNGIFSWVDENGTHHNQDAFEAVWEQMNGRTIEYPPSRYADIILMNPDNFGWRDDPAAPGVAWKSLGVFSERLTKIAFARLEPGATLAFGQEPSNEIAFVVRGELDLNGDKHPALTAFGSSKEDEPVGLTATEATTVFYVKLPTF
ncbi:hypothetical protein GA0115240_135284 [Streptomyces sp. DvalAA-14]|uniref:hypothetical protein n=1 Tax=unclassified Streptomyces TaxID=2593676 RepID=UPI00081B5FCC|nr:MULTISPECIES: hypothetical protein [unclassified Streptomyces]MYS21819.1 hypothetical protein [Streptomyces sp. SID4948]SCE01789.1 hypothetical protein GA0115240_135284 [Streptomyces sp. DvalAA-14]